MSEQERGIGPEPDPAEALAEAAARDILRTETGIEEAVCLQFGLAKDDHQVVRNLAIALARCWATPPVIVQGVPQITELARPVEKVIDQVRRVLRDRDIISEEREVERAARIEAQRAVQDIGEREEIVTWREERLKAISNGHRELVATLRWVIRAILSEGRVEDEKLPPDPSRDPLDQLLSP